MSSEHEMDDTPHEEVMEGDAGHEGGDEAHAADADFTDEDWNAEEGTSEGDHDGDGEGEGGEGTSPKKKKMKMNMMIIGGAVVIGLGGFYMMMSKKSVPLPPPSAMQAAVPKPPPTDTDMIYGASTEPDQPKTDKNKVAPKGILDDPNAIKKLQKMSDSHVVSQTELAPENPTPSLTPKEVKSAPPMPAPISQSEHKPAEGPLTPLPQESTGTPFAKVATATPPSAVPAPVPAPKATSLPEPVKVAPPASDKTASPAWPAPSGEKPVQPAGSETSATKIPDMGKPPASMSGAPAAMPGNAASSESLDRITNKLDTIESELKALKDSSVRKDELADVRTQLSSLQDKLNGMSGQTGSPPSPAKSAGVKTIHHRHVVRTASAPSSTRHKTMPVASSWTLKSAQPGMAIVAQGDGQLVTVKPGDKVHGLGRIKSISEQNGRWVVKGTAGVLTE